MICSKCGVEFVTEKEHRLCIDCLLTIIYPNIFPWQINHIKQLIAHSIRTDFISTGNLLEKRKEVYKMPYHDEEKTMYFYDEYWPNKVCLEYYNGVRWVHVGEFVNERIAWQSLGGDDHNYRTIDPSDGRVLQER